MRPLAYTLSGALVALALAAGTPTFAQERPSGGGGGGGSRPSGGEGGGGGHAVHRGGEGGGGGSSSSGSSSSWGGSSSGGGSTSGGSMGSWSGSGGSGGGHAIYRPSPGGERRGGGEGTRGMGTRGSELGRMGSAAEAGDPGQRAVPRGARINEAGRPTTGSAMRRGPDNPLPGRGDGYYRYYDPAPWYYSDYYRGYYNPYLLGSYWYRWPSYYGFQYYDPFWWGMSPYGYSPYYPYWHNWTDEDDPSGYYSDMPDHRAGGEDTAPVSNYGPRGGLKLKIQPRHAEVYADGYFVGVVDDFDGVFQHLALPAGMHRIEVKAKGFQSLSFDTRIEARDVISYKGELQPAKQ